MFIWQRDVAGIEFGGLVPQASSLLAEAAAFTVGGVHRMEAVLQKTSETVDTVYKAAVRAHILETHVTGAPAWKLTDEEVLGA